MQRTAPLASPTDKTVPTAAETERIGPGRKGERHSASSLKQAQTDPGVPFLSPPRHLAATKKKFNADFIYEVLSAVEEIPEGRVATYGQIARLIGRSQNARLVGRALSMASFYGNYPCHRVVNHAGRLVPGWTDQRRLLEAEGVSLKDAQHVCLKSFLWDCPIPSEPD